MQTSETTNNIFKAMIEAAPEIKAIAKNKQAYEYKYATLDNLIDMLRGVLPKHGLWFFQTATNGANGSLSLKTIIIHTSGEFIEETICFDKTDMTKGKPNDTQKIGAAITYFRRYSLASMFAVASDDDVDGKIEENEPQEAPKTKPKKQAQSPLEFIQKDIMDRIGAGETYESVLKQYSDLMNESVVKEPKDMPPEKQRDLANAIYKWRKGRDKR